MTLLNSTDKQAIRLSIIIFKLIYYCNHINHRCKRAVSQNKGRDWEILGVYQLTNPPLLNSFFNSLNQPTRESQDRGEGGIKGLFSYIHDMDELVKVVCNGYGAGEGVMRKPWFLYEPLKASLRN